MNKLDDLSSYFERIRATAVELHNVVEATDLYEDIKFKITQDTTDICIECSTALDVIDEIRSEKEAQPYILRNEESVTQHTAVLEQRLDSFRETVLGVKDEYEKVLGVLEKSDKAFTRIHTILAMHNKILQAKDKKVKKKSFLARLAAWIRA